MYRVLFNPLSKSGRNKKIIDHILDILRNMNEEFDLLSIIDIKNFNNYLDEIPLSDKILIVGGDGTIHYLVNFLDGKEITHEIYFYGAGTGNDFVRNIESKDEFVLINGYLNNLPIAYFEGIERRFVNGCGMGLDAYVCDCVNKGKGKSPIAYKINTIKGFMKYKKSDLSIEIDGVKEECKDVWLLSVMNGIHQGGGMKFTPDAIMNDDYLDICLIKGYKRLKVLTLFPKIYKGKHTKYVDIRKCQEIKITSDKGLYLQLDGEVISNVKELVVKSKKQA